jgi:arylsulfatase A-like enzyme
MKKHFILAAIMLIILAACKTEKQDTAKDQASEKKPNIIYILADDLGYGDLSSYGQKKFKTPNIDRLAAEGIRFTRHYSGSTVCAPSRSSLMTGLHTGHTPVRGNKEIQPEGQYPLADSVFTVAKMMQEAGYVTGAFGKWGLGAPGSSGDPNNQGFQEFYGYNCQRYAHRYYPEHLWHNQQKIDLQNNGIDTIEYAQDMIHEKAIEFLTKNKDNTFFMFMPYVIPHAELIVPDDEILASFEGKYPEAPYQGNDYGADFSVPGYTSQEQPHAVFAAMVTRLDRYVGDVLNKLEDLGIDENTIVMFTSDNGPHLEGGADPDFFDSNGVYKGYKRDLYEGGIRVPFLVRWPAKVQGGGTTNHASAFWDILPTFAELAQTETPANDGISFVNALTGQQQKAHDYLYWEFHEQGGKQAVSMGKWKGIRLDVLEDKNGPIELYDLENDPGEENNVANDHPEIVADINRIMKEARVENPVFTFIGN